MRPRAYRVKLNRLAHIDFKGLCIADVVALNHDDTVRKCFRAYRTVRGYVAERIDDPDTIDVRYWGAECDDILALYDFFGNEPLANYLYGVINCSVPGLRCMKRK